VNHSLKRIVAGLTAFAVVAFTLSVLSATAAHADHKRAGAAESVNPSGGAPVTSGGSATNFR